MASVRSLDNALEVSADVIAADGLTDPKITGDTGRTHIPNNGRIIRNLIHGADTVMSHITHFYHLAALDYIDASGLGAPFTPTYENAVVMLPPNTPNILGVTIVDNYVRGLTYRRKCHTMGAILSGRQPVQHAIVPGGVTTLPTASDMVTFRALLNDIRGFVNTAYIPDVITVATTVPGYFAIGGSQGNLLSYGEYPIQSGTGLEQLLLKRGVYSGGLIAGTTSGGPTALLANVREYVDYSYYSSPSGQYPGVGTTEPAVSKVTAGGKEYTWLKAPRWLNGTNPLPCEVGPLARMVVTYASGATETVPNTGASSWAFLTGLGTRYTAAQLVGATLNYFSAGVTALFSVLGRHAARALECKVVADAMSDWVDQLESNITGSTYVYAKLPTKPKSGAGWAEAPRGALGHWISIEKKRITNYQCVVPSTWNHSPIDTPGGTHGPAEDSLIGENIGTGTPGNDENMVQILRILHTFDFCIACAVHVVTTDGKTVSKFKMGTDGSVTKLPHDAEI